MPFSEWLYERLVDDGTIDEESYDSEDLQSKDTLLSETDLDETDLADLKQEFEDYCKSSDIEAEIDTDF